MNFDQFNQTISQEIIQSIQRRKEVFSFFATALSIQNAVTDDSKHDSNQVEQLRQEASVDIDKKQLLSWLETVLSLEPVCQSVTFGLPQ